MDLGLKGKVIIVTGGYSGIGEAIVKQAAKEGAIPVIVGRSAERGKALEATLKQEGFECFSVAAELSEAKQCQIAIEQVLAKYGRINALVNNAGFNDGVGLENGSPEKFMASIQNNIFHYYTMAHYALPALKKEQDSSIINISSKTGVTGQGGTSAYVASKAGQLGLTREWAVELLPYKIRVNAIAPAEVMTPLYEKWLNTFENPQEKLQEITRRIPLGKRMTTSEEIAYMTLFLISDKSMHTTGQIIYVDGGYTHLDRAIT
jgi:L-fucose dehydrogenase